MPFLQARGFTHQFFAVVLAPPPGPNSAPARPKNIPFLTGCAPAKHIVEIYN
jgi:hypothetical protein